jgi:hypothetical protein|tara:strand:+ start:441 stop:821 length:381 start_codon:yes stop_codon:yes gene_type:complete
MAFSNYLSNEILDHVFSGNAFTAPSNYYVALYTVAPTASGGGTEVTGGGYVRRAATFTTSATQSTNQSAVEFPTATAAYGNVVAAAVLDATSGGNLLAFANLTAAKNIAIGDVLRIPANDLDINLA